MSGAACPVLRRALSGNSHATSWFHRDQDMEQ
jgi:hypothetical protein